jgi:hypothetical protein
MTIPQEVLLILQEKVPVVPECSCPHKVETEKCHTECLLYKQYLERKLHESHKSR